MSANLCNFSQIDNYLHKYFYLCSFVPLADIRNRLIKRIGRFPEKAADKFAFMINVYSAAST